MLHRLRAVSFVFATVAVAATAFASRAVAQLPPGAMVATEHFIFVVHKNTLLKFDQETLALLGSVNLDRARRADVARGAARKRLEPEEPVIAESVRVQSVEPVEGELVEEVRVRPVRRAAARVGRTGAAVDAALAWLINHQDADGKWDADEFMKHDVDGAPCDGAGNPTKDVGVTALATLAMLGNGSTLRSGPHRGQLKSAVRWLMDQQQENGLVGTNASHDYIYGHAIASMALSEAYGLSNFAVLKSRVQKAVNYLESHRNPYSVWRYQPRDNDNDTSVTTWAVMAYCSAKSFGLDVNENALQLAASWYDQVSTPNGRAGYSKRGEPSSRHPGDHGMRFPPENGEAITAAALFARYLLDQKPATHPIMKASADLLIEKPPTWKKGHIDPYYWWFGTQAMFQVGGQHWRQWSRGLSDITAAQNKEGNAKGSWDPVGVWDMDGGRVYSTAMHALTLEVSRKQAELVR